MEGCRGWDEWLGMCEASITKIGNVESNGQPVRLGHPTLVVYAFCCTTFVCESTWLSHCLYSALLFMRCFLAFSHPPRSLVQRLHGRHARV